VAAGRRPEKIQETVDLITHDGARAMAISADVSKSGDVARLVRATVDRFGGVDILVNNAGVHVPGGILKVTEEQWDWIMSINAKGVFLCSKAVAPFMLAKKWGRIVNIATVGAITPSMNAAYCASKGAVVTLTKSMALELASGGVTVNVICPGTVPVERTRSDYADPDVLQYNLMKTRVGYLGEPSDIAAGVVYLSSPQARFVTGAVLPIDGGWTIV